MTDQNRQFDDFDRHVSDRLREDLRGLFGPPGPVPPQIDRTILDEAHRRLARPRRLIIRLRWAAGIAAAAAVIALGVVLYHPPASHNHRSSIIDHPSGAEGRADVDGNGCVDILDAFRLARSIEARGPADPRWDLNGDGRVDRADVDLIAAAAVRLAPGPLAHRGEGIPPLRTEAILASLLRGEGVPPLRGEGILPLRLEGILPLRVAGILPALRGRDALDTERQGQDGLGTQGRDALATNPLVVLLGKGV